MMRRLSNRSLLLAVPLAFIAACLGLTMLAAVFAQPVTVFMPVQSGRTKIAFELDRSPDCPNDALGLCDAGGQGEVYLSVWRYAWTTPSMREAQRLLAVPVAP